MHGREHIELLDCIIYNDKRLTKTQKLKELSDKLPLLLRLYYSVNKTLPEELLINNQVRGMMVKLIITNTNYTITLKTKNIKKELVKEVEEKINNNDTIKNYINTMLFKTINEKTALAEQLTMVKKYKQIDELIETISKIYSNNPSKIRLILIEDMSQYDKKPEYCKQISKLKLKTPCYNDTLKAYCSEILTEKMKNKQSKKSTRTGKKKHSKRKNKKHIKHKH